MGFKRKIWQAVLGLALLNIAAAGQAEPEGEPLVVTRLPDPETHMLTTSGTDEDSSLDARIGDFSRAISQATLADQQAMQARCRAAIPASGADRLAWEASCRYRRH